MLNILILIIIKIFYPYPIFADEPETIIENGVSNKEVVENVFYDESEFHNRLHRLLITSHRQYLDNEFDKAMDTLKEIVDLRLVYDWRSDKRAIIANSYIRLIELDIDNQNKWIREFVSFNGTSGVDSDSVFDKKLINSINSKANKIKKEMVKWYADNLPKNVEYVRVNGEKVYLVDVAYDILEDATYRITLFFDDGNSMTRVLTGLELINYNWNNNKFNVAEIPQTTIPISFNSPDPSVITPIPSTNNTDKFGGYIKKNWKALTLYSVIAVALTRTLISGNNEPKPSYEGRL